MDGIQLIEKIYQELPIIRTVIISGYSDFEFARTALKNHASDYLLKPINPYELQKTLRKLSAEILAEKKEFIPRRNDSPEVVVERTKEYLRINYSGIIDFSQIAEQNHFSSAYLTKIFKEQCGTTPAKFLLDYRMKTAKKMLIDSDLSVKTIGEKVGFPDPFHFSKTFKTVYGISPAQFREHNQQL